MLLTVESSVGTESKRAGALLGREGELAQLEAALDRLERTEIVAVGGEPGIGKTRLLAELCERADQRSMLVLNGRTAEFERDLPFAALVDALDDYLGSLNPRVFSPIGEESLSELAHLFPSLRELDVPAPSGLQDERYRSHQAVRALLETLSARKPLVLALDDLHWADEATLELLAHLLRRRPRSPVLVAFAFRSGQPMPALSSALDELESDPALTAIRPRPLSESDSDRLLGELDPDLRPGLFQASGGNPFYLEELARSASAAPAGRPESEATGAAGGVPELVRSALTGELGSLGEPVREFAQGCAVAGEPFEPELAAAAAGIGAPDALERLDQLLDADLLRHTEVPRRFRFRHPIVRHAVYESAKPGWRLAAHARVAAALEEIGAPPLARARHIECSARPGDRDAVAILTAAGQDATLRAPGAAAHWYRSALRLLDQANPGERLGLLIPLAQALGYVGRFDESQEALDQALSLLPPDQAAVRGQLIAARARIDALLGRHGKAHAQLVAALEAIPERSSPEATELKVQLASECFFSADFAGMRDWVAEALKDAADRDDTATEAAATGLLGCGEYMVGDADAAREHLGRAAVLFERVPDEELARRLHSLTWCGICEAYLGRFDAAEALLDRSLAVARATGHGHVTTLARIGRATVHLWRGELDSAAEHTELAIEAARLTANDQFLCWALWARCWVATLSGELIEAVRLGEQALERVGPEPDPVSAMAGCRLAEARLEAGDAEACREQMLSSAGGPELPLVERPFQPHLCEILARAEVVLGDTEAAEEWVSRAEREASGLGVPGRTAEALRARAALALARGEAAEASERALEAVAVAAEAGIPIDEARGRILAGRALAGADLERAVTELEAARDALAELGAGRYRDQAAAELRALGRRPKSPARRRAKAGNGVDSLSEREREIAELVAAGRTNREVAAELYLSPKTIESHLSRVFSKLGVSKRAQLAATIERERAASGPPDAPA